MESWSKYITPLFVVLLAVFSLFFGWLFNQGLPDCRDPGIKITDWMQGIGTVIAAAAACYALWAWRSQQRIVRRTDRAEKLLEHASRLAEVLREANSRKIMPLLDSEHLALEAQNLSSVLGKAGTLHHEIRGQLPLVRRVLSERAAKLLSGLVSEFNSLESMVSLVRAISNGLSSEEKLGVNHKEIKRLQDDAMQFLKLVGYVPLLHFVSSPSEETVGMKRVRATLDGLEEALAPFMQL